MIGKVGIYPLGTILTRTVLDANPAGGPLAVPGI